MLNSPEGVLKHKDITNASLTIVGEHVLFMPLGLFTTLLHILNLIEYWIFYYRSSA